MISLDDIMFGRPLKAIEGIVRCGNAVSHPSKLVLINLVLRGPSHLDRLCLEVGLPADAVASALLELVDMGLIDSERGSITDNILRWAEREQVT